MTPTSVEEQDQADMARLKGDQDTALNDLMERHGEKLFHYLIRALQNEDEAADVAQDTFVRIYQNRARFDSRRKFSAWLYAIATNLVKDRYRYRSRHPNVSLDAERGETEASIGETLADPGGTPAENLDSFERGNAVRKAIATLAEELRLPLILAEYENRTQAEIAEILGCTSKAVETRLYRARHKLREKLAGIN